MGIVSQADRLFQQAMILLNQGRLGQSREILENVVKLNPNQFDAFNLLGIIAAQLKELELAEELFDKAIKLNPNKSTFYCNRGNVLKELKLYDKALIQYDKAIVLNKDYALAYLNRSIALSELNQYEEALKSSAAAIRIKFDYAEAYYQHGIILTELKRYEEALHSYDKAIVLKPHYAEAYSNRGVVLKELKRFEESLASYEKAIGFKPDYAEAYSNRGLVLNEFKRFEEAKQSYNKAIELKVDYAEAYFNLANVLSEMKRFEESLENYDKAIKLKNDYVKAYLNRGNVLANTEYFNLALTSYDKVIELNNDYFKAYWNKALLLLLLQDYKNGWHLYEWRWKSLQKNEYRNFPQPTWLGTESLEKKTILLHAEQGLGDTIQFCRYAALVKRIGARVLLEVPESLMKLLQGLDGIDQLIEAGTDLPAFDYQCPLLSLPLAFKTEVNSIPSSTAYIKSSADKLDTWNQRLGAKSKPRIGLVWSGSPTHTNDHSRSLALADLINDLPNGFEYVSLQKEVRDSDKETLANSDIKHYGEKLVDFTDTAALCDLMDLVISVDTSVAHLSAALGKPTWILLAFNPDWRWMLNRDDSPWYESVKLYRQGEDRQWDAVLERVAIDLNSSIND